jgi:CheY-like chemotaxis protein
MHFPTMPATTAPAEPGPAPAQHPPRILVVEDEPLVAIATLSALEARFVLCGAAATSSEALRLATAVPPDLAVIDLQLADGRTGVALARELRSRFGTVCLVTTSWLAPDERAELDAHAVLHKPYSDADLLTAVTICLSLKPGDTPIQLPDGLTLLAF